MARIKLPALLLVRPIFFWHLVLTFLDAVSKTGAQNASNWSCSFDNGLCPGWRSTPPNHWRTGRDSSIEGIPAYSGEGFAFAGNDAYSTSLPEDRYHNLQLPQFTANEDETVSGTISFWYNFGFGTATLALNRRARQWLPWHSDPENQIVWRETKTVAHETQIGWRNVTVSFCVKSSQVLEFHAVLHSTSDVVALDEIITDRDPASLEVCGPPVDSTCPFESGLCGWVNIGANSLAWQRTQGEAGQGSYYMQTVSSDPFNAPSVARLSSLPFEGDAGGTGNVTFMYRLPFGDTGYLRLLLEGAGQETEVWSSDGQVHNEWQNATIDIAYKAGDVLVFQTNLAEAEIDDYRFTDDNPPMNPSESSEERTRCDFEFDLCGWHNEGISPLTWQRTQGEAGQGIYYMQTISANPFSTSSVARLRSIPLNRDVNDIAEITFLYRLPLGDSGYLRLLRSSSDQETEVWKSDGQVHNEWQRTKFVTCYQRGDVMIFETNIAEAEIDSFDDFSPADPGTVNVSCDSLKITCDFEEGTCGWDSPYINQTLLGNVVSGSPNATGGNGGWFLFTASPLAQGNMVSRLYTRHEIRLRRSAQFSFWYYANGTAAGSLRLLKRTRGGFTTLLWKNEQGNNTDASWKEAEVELCDLSPFALEFRATWTDHDQLVGLDEVELTDEEELVGSIPDGSYTCPDGTCVEATHQNVSCQFGELNTCGWTLSDPVNGWKPTVGVSGTGSYGINQTDDYYLVLDGSLSSSSGTSEISTNLISPLRGSFRFSFRAFGYGIAFLRLSVENAEGRKRLWETGDAGREWQLQSIPLCMDLPFRIIFEGRFLAPGFVLALDQFNLGVTCGVISPQCPEFVPDPTSEILGPILPASWNGSISCDFEENQVSRLCDWRDVQLDGQGPSWNANTTAGFGAELLEEPPRGFAVASFANAVNVTGSVARLMSANLPSVGSSAEITLEFYYRTSIGVSGLSLFVATKKNLPRVPVVAFGPGSGGLWNRAVAQFQVEASSRQQLVIEVRLPRRTVWTAIDNIVLDGENGASVEPPPPAPTSSPFLPVLEPGTCSFDAGICFGWTNIGSLEWKENWNDTYNITAHSGRGYVYLVPGGTYTTGEPYADLGTPLFNEHVQSTSGRITFWYRLGDGIAHLELQKGVRAESFRDSARLLWSRSSTEVAANVWHEGSVYFCARGQEVLVFRGVSDFGFTYVALDEILSVREQNESCPRVEICQKWQRSEKGSCNFDRGFCDGWTNTNTIDVDSDDYGFVFQTGSVANISGPQSGNGYLVNECYFNDPRPNNSYTSLIIPDIALPIGSSTGRLSFWYNVYLPYSVLGSQRPMISVNTVAFTENGNLQGQGASMIFHQVFSNTTNQWMLLEVPFTMNSRHFAFVLELDLSSCEMVVALDSVVTEFLVPYDCLETNVTCNFEGGSTCGWANQGNTTNWTVGTPPVGTAPFEIPSTSSGSQVLFVDSNILYSGDQSAVLESIELEPMQNTISFDYYSHSSGNATIRLFAEINGHRELLWRTQGPGTESWLPVLVELCFREQFKLVFEAQFSGESGIVGLDTIVLGSPTDPAGCPDITTTTTVGTTAKPTVAPVPPITLPDSWFGPISCSFENNSLCDWRNFNVEEQRSSNWTVVTNLDNGSVNISEAYEGTYFAAVRAGQENSSFARMISPDVALFYTEHTFQLEFYYRASGPGISGLAVYAATSNTFPTGPSWGVLLGTVNQWNRGVVTVSIDTQDNIDRCQLIIEARLNERNSWIAIDAIVLDGEDGNTIPPVPPTAGIIDQATCGFDSGFCPGWKSEGLLSWQANYSNQEPVIAPQFGNGFVYVKKDLLVNQDEQRAELETPLINSNKTLGTMTFWYLLGKGATTLDVYAKSPTAAGADQAFTSTVWSITLTHDNNDEAHWKKAAVTFCFDGPRSFVFRVTTLGEFTVAALDEVFTIGTQGIIESCPAELTGNHHVTCNFDENLCGWRSEPGNSLGWTRSEQEDPDASSGNFYIKSENRSSESSLGDSVARLFSPYVNQFVPTATQLTFFYRLADTQLGYLKLNIRLGDAEFEIWRQRGSNNDTWQQGAVSICNAPGYQLIFETNVRNAGVDAVVLAGELSPAENLNIVCPSPILSCDFEDGFCGWNAHHVGNASFYRTRGSASLSEAHGGEWFITNSNTTGQQRIQLASYRPIKLKDATQFSFWYRANISSVEYLTLIKSSRGYFGEEAEVIWRLENSSGAEWLRARVDICEELEFTLSFYAQRNSSDHNIQLDDFVLYRESELSGELPPDTFSCPGIPQTTISCGFENGDLCGWQNDPAQAQWVAANGSVGSPPYTINSAPAGGSYLVAQSNQRPTGTTTFRILSRPTTSAMPHNTKLSFWIKMKGDGAGYLRLSLVEGALEQVVWQRTGHQDVTWILFNLTICTSPGARFLFEASFHLPDYVIGLDEIQYQGEFNAQLAIPGQCLVATCNFERNLCGWSSLAGLGGPRWYRSRVLSGGLAQPEYVGSWHIQTRTLSSNVRSVSRLQTSCFRIEEATTIDFWYNAIGQGTGSLKVSAEQSNGTEVILWEADQSQSTRTWQHSPLIPVPATETGVILLLDGFTDSSSLVIAVDDITLMNEAELMSASSDCAEVIPATAPTTTLPASTVEPVYPVRQTHSCSFDRNFCVWQNSRFIIESGNGSYSGDGYATTNQSTALLVGPQVSLTRRAQLFFYYDISSDAGNFLAVRARFGRHDVRTLFEIWGSSLTSANYGKWMPARVSLCFPGTFSLEIHALRSNITHKFGLDEIVINDESVSLSPPSPPVPFNCPIQPLPTSITCEAAIPTASASPPASYCGWTARPSNNMNIAIGVVPSLPGQTEYSLVVQPNDTSVEGVVEIESVNLPPTTSPGAFSFNYILRGSKMQVELVIGSITATLPTGTSNGGSWMTFSVEVPATSSASKIIFRVTLSQPQSMSRSVWSRSAMGAAVRADGDEELFALRDTWYSAETGYVPGPQTDVPPVTTTGTSAIPSGVSTVTAQITGSTTPARPTQPPLPTQTTTLATTTASQRGPVAPNLSTGEIVAISVGSVAGAMIMLGVFLACLHCRTKRKEKRRSDYLPEVVTTRELTTTAVSKPPTYSSRPASAAGTTTATTVPVSQGFKTRAFDEETERL